MPTLRRHNRKRRNGHHMSVATVHKRPRPPEFEPGTVPPDFIPAPDLANWAMASFVVDGAPLENPDHQHLRDAIIGCLWATIPNSRHMVQVVGQAERSQFQGGKWIKARQEQQMRDWFGELPDFILTFDAGYASVCDDGSFCALVEHELAHCGQALDKFGGPKFTRDGQPVYVLKGHDVEEFVCIVRRYGAGRGAGKTLDLVQAAMQRPSVTAAAITGACGTCRTKF